VGKVTVKQEGDALVMELATGALKLSPWDGEIFTATLMPNGPLAAMAGDLGRHPISYEQYQMYAIGTLSRFTLV
jgi:hypothetical protein